MDMIQICNKVNHSLHKLQTKSLFYFGELLCYLDTHLYYKLEFEAIIMVSTDYHLLETPILEAIITEISDNHCVSMHAIDLDSHTTSHTSQRHHSRQRRPPHPPLCSLIPAHPSNPRILHTRSCCL